MSDNVTTDIHVVVDPQYVQLPQFAPLMEDAMGLYSNTSAYGKRIPVIMINARVIVHDELIGMFLDFRETYPSGYIDVKDRNNSIYRTENPGTDNLIMITITPKTNESYRKIKISGYIVSVDSFGDGIYRYNFKYKYIPLENAVVRSWSLLTTYELFKSVATELKLGFAVGEKVEEIEDVRYRYCCGMKIRDFLKSQIQVSGNSKDTVMDFWLDPWGYINVVNINHQLYAPIDDTEISMTVGRDTVMSEFTTTIYDVKVPRLITNMDFGERLNINIESCEYTTDNSLTCNYGNSYIDFVSHAGDSGEADADDNVTTVLEETAMPGMTADSKNTDSNSFKVINYSGFELDDTPAMPQARARKNILGQISGSGAIFTMAQPNFGLIRGVRVSVILVSNGPSKHRNTGIEADNILDNEFSQPVFDEYHSGLYYITGTSFEYDNEHDDLIQKIYAVKLTPSVSPNYIVTNDDGTHEILETAQGISQKEQEINGN